jgi:hypothetical protein
LNQIFSLSSPNNSTGVQITGMDMPRLIINLRNQVQFNFIAPSRIDRHQLADKIPKELRR